MPNLAKERQPTAIPIPLGHQGLVGRVGRRATDEGRQMQGCQRVVVFDFAACVMAGRNSSLATVQSRIHPGCGQIPPTGNPSTRNVVVGPKTPPNRQVIAVYYQYQYQVRSGQARSSKLPKAEAAATPSKCRQAKVPHALEAGQNNRPPRNRHYLDQARHPATACTVAITAKSISIPSWWHATQSTGRRNNDVEQPT